PPPPPLFPYTTLFRSPPFALIVEDAARVEAEVAADRAHIAVGRAGDDMGGLRHHRKVRDDLRVLGEFRKRHRSADFETTRVVARSEEHTSELQSRGHL